MAYPTGGPPAGNGYWPDHGPPNGNIYYSAQQDSRSRFPNALGANGAQPYPMPNAPVGQAQNWNQSQTYNQQPQHYPQERSFSQNPQNVHHLPPAMHYAASTQSQVQAPRYINSLTTAQPQSQAPQYINPATATQSKRGPLQHVNPATTSQSKPPRTVSPANITNPKPPQPKSTLPKTPQSVDPAATNQAQPPLFVNPAQIFQQTTSTPPQMFTSLQQIVQPQQLMSEYSGGMTASNAAKIPIEHPELLISLAEEFFDAAYNLAPSVAISMTKPNVQAYEKLIAAGLACLDTAMRRVRLSSPRMEANIRLRYAGVLYEETDNFMEAETALGKGIALCERVCTDATVTLKALTLYRITIMILSTQCNSCLQSFCSRKLRKRR
jgi:hypothetical protein